MAGSIRERVLEEVADLHGVPARAYNIRASGQTVGRNIATSIDIVTRTDKLGISIRIKPGTGDESICIPVVASTSGLEETVYSDFFIGENSDVVIVADYGIHNCGDQDSEHGGIHRFFMGRNVEVKYVEKRYGEGDGSGKRILNPGMEVYMEEGSCMEMEVIQIEGVDFTNRTNSVGLAAGAKLTVRERLLTYGSQNAESTYIMNLSGEDSSADVVSRSIAKDTLKRTFNSKVVGNAKCSRHTEYDTVIMDSTKIFATPGLAVNNTGVVLIHEAAIGKIAGEQIVKSMTLCLTEEEAGAQIVNGSLKQYIGQLGMDRAAATQRTAARTYTGMHDTGGTQYTIQRDKDMGEDREGGVAALLPTLIFLLTFLGSGFITGGFYSMPVIMASLTALLAVLVQNRELGFPEIGDLSGYYHSPAPIAAGISQKAGFFMVVCAGTAVGGVMFGGNPSTIPDTTIAAIKTQGCEMKDKFGGNFLIMLPAAIITILLFLTLGKDASSQIQSNLDYGLLRVMLCLIVLTSTLAGIGTFLILMTGTVLSPTVGMATDTLEVGGMFIHVGEGITAPYCLYPILMGVSGLILIFIKKGHEKVLT